MDPTVAGRATAAPHATDRTNDRVAGFDAWARSSRPTLLRFAAVVCGNPHDGADRVQDALAAVYPRWARLSADGAADAYARRVIDRSVSWWRKVRRREQPPSRGPCSHVHRALAQLRSTLAEGDDHECLGRACRALRRRAALGAALGVAAVIVLIAGVVLILRWSAGPNDGVVAGPSVPAATGFVDPAPKG